MISVVVAVVIGVVTLMIVTVFVTLATGSVMAAGIVIALILIGFIVLIQYGFMTINVTDSMLDVKFWDTLESDVNKAAVPDAPPARPLKGKEVFYVGQERFIYEDAPAVCAAYDAELATQDQVEDAYAKGAEWCEYGWSAGGVALFPTQRETWETLQTELDPKKRTACGRPGVNGGYFDPTLKFGVNCYGVKPLGDKIKFPLPPPGTDTSVFDAKVKTFKDQMKDFFLAPFSRTTWSGDYGTQFAQNLGGLISDSPEAVAAAAAAKADPSTAPGTVGVKKMIVSPGGSPSVGVPAASGTSVNASATAAAAAAAPAPAPTPAPTPAPAPTSTTGKPYDNTKVYQLGDVVVKDGISYVMIDGIGAPGYPPPRPTNWKPV